MFLHSHIVFLHNFSILGHSNVEDTASCEDGQDHAIHSSSKSRTTGYAEFQNSVRRIFHFCKDLGLRSLIDRHLDDIFFRGFLVWNAFLFLELNQVWCTSDGMKQRNWSLPDAQLVGSVVWLVVCVETSIILKFKHAWQPDINKEFILTKGCFVRWPPSGCQWKVKRVVGFLLLKHMINLYKSAQI